MLDFLYHIKLTITEDDINIFILLSNHGTFIPVYIRTCDKNILSNKEYFEVVFNEFKEYLNRTKIVISKENLLLLLDKINKFKLPIPKLISITLTDYFEQKLEKYQNIFTTKELLYLIFIDGKEVNSKSLKDWETENRLNAAYLTDTLLSEGYISKDIYHRNLLKANRSLLLSVVEEYKLNVIGDNKDLIKTIQSELNDEQLKKWFSGTHYHLTDKGQETVNKNMKLDEFNKSHYHFVDNMRIEEFYLLSIKKPEYNYQAISRLLLSKANIIDEVYIDWKELNENINNFPLNKEIDANFKKLLTTKPINEISDIDEKMENKNNFSNTSMGKIMYYDIPKIKAPKKVEKEEETIVSNDDKINENEKIANNDNLFQTSTGKIMYYDIPKIKAPKRVEKEEATIVRIDNEIEDNEKKVNKNNLTNTSMSKIMYHDIPKIKAPKRVEKEEATFVSIDDVIDEKEKVIKKDNITNTSIRKIMDHDIPNIKAPNRVKVDEEEIVFIDYDIDENEKIKESLAEYQKRKENYLKPKTEELKKEVVIRSNISVIILKLIWILILLTILISITIWFLNDLNIIDINKLFHFFRKVLSLINIDSN